MLSEYRQKIVEKIEELEIEKRFDVDVEVDPPSTVLNPEDVDYLNEKFISKVLAKISYSLGERYYKSLQKKGEFTIKAVYGMENFKSCKGGAIITANHFSFYDNYIIAKSLEKELSSDGLYKVIREGNYTGFKGFYGVLFRHARTLPLSSNIKTMKKFYIAMEKLLSRGEKILIYPEQSMWWNYRKPRPYKKGAFRFAVKYNVPIIPMFMTMEDSKNIDRDGAFAQEITLWILPPIYKDENISDKENEQIIMEKNYNLVVNLYERVYKKKLEYKN